MASLRDEIKRIYRSGGNETRFLIINVAVFILIGLVNLFLFLYKRENELDAFINQLCLPADLNSLGELFWTPLTYQFLHIDFFHILFNMLVLYWFGKIFTQFIGNKKFPLVYIAGGLTGALFYVLAYNVFPVFESRIATANALGASASVMGIMIASAAFAPELNIRILLFGTIRLKYVALIMVGIDLLSITGNNPGGHIAHLGGAMFGLIYGLSIQQGNVFSRFFNQIKKIFRPGKRKPRMKVSYKKPVSDEDFNRERASRQKRTDAILDKISQQGYESLTKEEKDFLFNQKK